MTTLYGRREEKMTLVEAIAACQPCFGTAVGLFYSPESCFFSQIKGIGVTESSGQPCTLDRVFEARIFNADYELRWLNQEGGEGIAVLLSEFEIGNYLTEKVDDLQAIDTQEQTYLLWGKGGAVDNLASGWIRLATSRIGKLDVPISGAKRQDQQVRLKAKEYFQVLDDLYGNVIVADERLIGLQLLISQS
jgi:CRISPR-associated protein (TIGR03984 family)